MDSLESDIRRKLLITRRKWDEAFAREERLMQQLQLLERRREEMVRRELSSIEELEKLEEEERKSAAGAPLSGVGSSLVGDDLSTFDWASLGSPSAWELPLLDSAGDTVSPSVGNSSGA